MSIQIETDVLIIGSGPAGGSAALFLSTYGVENMVLTKYRWTANTPRAHITNQRTMEIFRDMGIEEDVVEKATPQELMGNNVFCTSLAGEEFARLRTWGTHPSRMADYTLSSPSRICDCPQTLMEPILLGQAAARGSRVRFDTEYLSLEQDADGVTATVRDRIGGSTYQIRARYLLGADGARSVIAKDIGLPLEGQMDIAGSMNIVFSADLSKYVAHRPGVLYWVLQPGSDIGGIGMGTIRMVRPWNEWLIIWGYDINDPPTNVDDEAATRIAHTLIGDDTIPIQIRSTSLWSINHLYATRYSNGRVFCMGDAVHRHPPSNGLGSNTSIQDAYNLAWKLALVLKGAAGPGLLDTYTAERAPVGRQIVDRANLSRDQFGPIFDALGVAGGADDEGIAAGLAACRAETAEGAKRRRALEEAIELKNYEFNAHGVELNQRYRSAAVLGDGAQADEWDRDPELHYRPTTRPGAKLPHAWLVDERGQRISTLDAVGHGRFTLVTGVSGGCWGDAARAVGLELGIEVPVVRVGAPGFRDAYGEWARLREIDEDGCLLVRPDGYIAWRQVSAPGDAGESLGRALR